MRKAREIRNHLAKQGWPEPIVADSGNGGHLMYAVSLPTDDDGLVQRCLVALAENFSDEQVTIDQTVYNPARIWKLYGVARKGDHTTERPHRLSRILESPKQISEVKTERLRELAQTVPMPTIETSPRTYQAPQAPQAHRAIRQGQTQTIERWLNTHQVEVARHGPWHDGHRAHLNKHQTKRDIHRHRAA